MNNKYTTINKTDLFYLLTHSKQCKSLNIDIYDECFIDIMSRLYYLFDIYAQEIQFDKQDILSLSRKHKNVLYRYVFFYIARFELGFTTIDLSIFFDKNHSSIITGCNYVNNNITKTYDKHCLEIYEKASKFLRKQKLTRGGNISHIRMSMKHKKQCCISPYIYPLLEINKHQKKQYLTKIARYNKRIQYNLDTLNTID